MNCLFNLNVSVGEMSLDLVDLVRTRVPRRPRERDWRVRESSPISRGVRMVWKGEENGRIVGDERRRCVYGAAEF